MSAKVAPTKQNKTHESLKDDVAIACRSVKNVTQALLLCYDNQQHPDNSSYEYDEVLTLQS